jgi:uncharacterized protein (DUF362 family)
MRPGDCNSGVYVTALDRDRARISFAWVLGNLERVLPQVAPSVVIKINLCDYRRAETGAVTDPLILEALIDGLRDRVNGCSITVVENDASALEASSAFKLLGIAELCERKGVKAINVAHGGWVAVPLERARILDRVEVPEVVAKADLYVNFAKLKTNSYCKVTGVLKNAFGLLQVKRKSVYHRCLDEVLVDLNRALPRGLYLVDGFIGMEAWGPAFGVPRRCGLLIGGTDPVAVDACCARIMGFNPHLVGHLRKCAKAGIGSLRYRLVTDLPDFRYRHYRFRYNRIEHMGRSVLRKFFHFGG